MTQPDLSVVILSWNTKDMTLACLRALATDASPRSREIVVVDNGSEDGSPDGIAAAFPDVVLIRNEHNRLYAEGNNQGVEAASGRWVCTLNSDTEVTPGALDRLIDFLEQNPGHAAVAPKLTNSDGTVQKTCRRFPGLVDALVDCTVLRRFPPGSWIARRGAMADFDHEHTRDVDQPPGACLMLAREEYQDLGGLDPELSLFFNDVDFCRRLWARGRRVAYLAEASVVHVGGASTEKVGGWNSLWFKNRTTYFRKHYGVIGGAWMRLVLFVWALETGLGIMLGSKQLPEKKAAFGQLRVHMKQCRAAR